MPSITVRELEKRLRRIPICQFAGLTALTEPAMRKRGNPFAGKVLKISHASGVINWRYARVVNRQRKREGKPADFMAAPRQWGQRVRHCPLVEHVAAGSGQTLVYLELKVQHRTDRFVHIDDRVEIPAADLQPWLRQPSRTRQQLDTEIVLRDFRLDHIGAVRINREEWTIRPVFGRLNTYEKAMAAAAEKAAAADSRTRSAQVSV